MTAVASQWNIKRNAQDTLSRTVTTSSYKQSTKQTKNIQVAAKSIDASAKRIVNDDLSPLNECATTSFDDIDELLCIDGNSCSLKKSTGGKTDDRIIISNIADAVMASIFDDRNDATLHNIRNYRNSSEYIKLKQFYKDSIRGKALILQNTAMQLKASQYKQKHKNIHKRRNVLSNKQMKKLCRCDPLELPPAEFIQEMHQHWWSYAKQVVFNSQSEAQLQARYNQHHLPSISIISSFNSLLQ